MDKLKKVLKYVFFLPPLLSVLLFLASLALLAFAFVFEDSASPVSIAAYALSAYSLSAVCVQIPSLISFVKKVASSRAVVRWRRDVRLRVNVTLLASALYNFSYAIFQLCLGLEHKTIWFISNAVYFLVLSLMRLFLFSHTVRNVPGEKSETEFSRYLAVGVSLVIINSALASMSFFMVWQNRTFEHHQITTIAMAAYTFTSLTFAIINVFKYRKYNSPVLSASRVIGLTSAVVSMLTLESTMLTTFGGDMEPTVRRLFLGFSSGAVTVFIMVLAVNMIARGVKMYHQGKS